jgi:hypothetical protein
MTNEERQLLLKDLCARLPYGVKIHGPKENDDILWELDYNMDIKKIVDEGWLPYLRPMESMTLEEYDELMDIPNIALYKDGKTITNGREVDWLNKKMFDYRGLIPMGLALPAKEGMYKND